MMFLNEELELDIENEGDRLVEPIAALIDVTTRRAPKFATFVAMAIAEWRQLVAQIAGAFAGERRNRRASSASCSAANIRWRRKTTTICRCRSSR